MATSKRDWTKIYAKRNRLRHMIVDVGTADEDGWRTIGLKCGHKFRLLDEPGVGLIGTYVECGVCADVDELASVVAGKMPTHRQRLAMARQRIREIAASVENGKADAH